MTSDNLQGRDAEFGVLSFAQERLWFLDQLTTANPVYNRPVAFKIRGRLDRARLEASLHGLVERHAVLRTTYESIEGRPAARVSEGWAGALEVFESAAEDMTPEAFARQPLNLAEGPVFRAGLFHIAEDRHVLVLVIHHSAFDAGSVNVLRRDLLGLYKGQELPDLPAQYSDFAGWQRAQFQGQRMERQLAYWMDRLSGSPLVLDLPLDHQWPAHRTYAGQTHRHLLPDALVSRLTSIGRAQHATRFMVLLAAFNVLLYRLTAERDLLVGVPVGMRSQLETEGLIGNFLNNLVIRTMVDPEYSFTDLLAAQREIMLDALSHRDVPFEKLVEAIQPDRDLSYSPLFQVVFNYENFPDEAPVSGDVTLADYTLDTRLVQYDLAVEVLPVEGGLACDWRFNTDLFEPAAIERIAGHYATLLEAIADDPAQAVGDLRILSPAQWQRLIVDWNHAEVAIDADRTLHEWIERTAAHTPDHTAMLASDREWTFAQFNRAANRLAHLLLEQGLQIEDRVGIVLELSPDYVIAVLAVLKAGGAYVPLNPRDPAARLATLLDDVGVSATITDETIADRLGVEAGRVIVLEEGFDDLSRMPETEPDVGVQPEHLAYILFTSGTTGQPKGVMVEHRQIVSYLRAVQDRIPLRDGQYAVLQATHVDATLTLLLSALTQGGTLHLFGREQSLDAAYLAAYFARQPIDYLKITPSHLQALGMTEPLVGLLPRIALVLGGEAASRELVRDVLSDAPSTMRLFNHYGPTETTVGVTACELSMGDVEAQRIIPIGRPLANSRAYILDEDGQPVPVGIAGELYIGGLGVTRGYWNRPEATRKRFVPDPFLPDEDGRMYRTGDRARFRPDGVIEFLGRYDHQIKSRGFRIEPGEIEAVLNKHPAVSASLVIDHELESGVTQLIAYIVSEAGQAPATDDIYPYLAGLLPDYMRPARIVVLDDIPMTPGGKVDRRALPLPGVESASEGDPVESDDPLVTALLEVWRDVLEVASVDVHDNFFDLGGHSLLVLYLIARIEQQIGAAVPVVDVFDAPTIAQLAERLRARLP